MPILNMVGGGKKGGGNIGEPLNLTVTSSGLDATIKWEDNEIGTIPPTTFQKSELVRKVGSAPSSPSDGTLVVTETVKDTYKTTGYVDQGLTDGTTYYYRVFSYSDLGGISYCEAQSVTIHNERQPGANTIVYRPVDGDMKDYSGNGYDLQGSPTSYETLSSGLKVGVFDGNLNPRPGNIYPNTTSILQVTQHNTNNFTVSFWINIVTFTPETGIMYVQGTGSYKVFYWQVNNTDTFRFGLGNGAGSEFAYKDFNTTNSANTWYHIVFVYDYNSGSPYVKCYKDGVLLDTINTNAFNNWTAWDCGTIMYSHSDNSCKKISRWIIEDKVWTAQEVSDYFDGTKADYGIS